MDLDRIPERAGRIVSIKHVYCVLCSGSLYLKVSSLGDMKYQMDDLDVRYFESALMVISICCHFVVLSSTVNTKTQREEQLHIRPHNYS